MINTLSTSNAVYGLFELDSAGTVMYSKIEAGDFGASERTKFVGLNFFEEVAPFKNVQEFRRRFRYFAQNSVSSEKFNFVCQFDEQPLEVKVMLTQIFESQLDTKSKLIIVDIRKV